MDERRFQISASILFIVFLFTLARVITSTNPIYTITEPVVSWLNDATKDFGVVTRADSKTADDSASDQALELEEENAQLREQLELTSSNERLIASEVVRRDLFGFSKTVWINSGESSGISKGDVALVDGNLFGEIVEVYEKSSVVKLITDPTFRVTVEADKDNHGILKVDHGSLIVDLLPSKELAGKRVASDGLDSNFPSGITLGSLGEESGDNADVFGRYSLILPYNVIDVDFVQIRLQESR